MKFKLITNYIVAFFILGGFVLIAYAENELTELNTPEQVVVNKNSSSCTKSNDI